MITATAVAAWLGHDLDSTEMEIMDQAVQAVIATVTQWHGDPIEWTDRVDLGAIMLAAHLWRRRGTPGGVAGFTEEGVSYVQRHDPQAAMLLGLGGWTRPAVG